MGRSASKFAVEALLYVATLAVAAAGCSDKLPSSDPGPTNVPAVNSVPAREMTKMQPSQAGTTPALDAAVRRAPTTRMLDAALEDSGADAGRADGGRAREGIPVPPPVAKGCVNTVQAGEQTFTCNGMTFETSIPERCIETQCGLIIDVHGGTMSAAMENKNTNMRELGRQHGYVVIQPNANAGLFDPMTDDPNVFEFANTVIDVFHLDPDRIHMMGFSQGGYMTWRFVCAHTDWLASAAPAAAAGAANISDEVGCTFTGQDKPMGELDVLYMHGRQDALVDFTNAGVLRDAVIATYGATTHEVVASGVGFTRTRHSNAAGTRFEFIEHDYFTNSEVGYPPYLGLAIVGHCYPGSDDHEITEDGQLMAFGCEPPTAFTWSEEAMAFFEAHPRR